jgi:hypothetical protein
MRRLPSPPRMSGVLEGQGIVPMRQESGLDRCNPPLIPSCFLTGTNKVLPSDRYYGTASPLLRGGLHGETIVIGFGCFSE